jgi:hypothetical protein
METDILVLGAGELGMAMLNSLSRLAPSGTSISVLLRPSSISSPSSAQAANLSQIRSLNISIVPGDISSSASQLAEIFKPYGLIISCLGFASGPGSQLKIARAVLQAGVKRYFPWQFGVDYDEIGRGSAQDLFDEQLDVRDLLRGQAGTEWVIVSTGMFTSFLFEEYFGVAEWEKGVVRALGGWENKVTVTTPEDIGRLTAEIVFSKSRIANQIVYTAGETVSYATLADYVQETKGMKVEKEVWSVDKLKKDLEASPNNAVNKYRVVFAQGRGVSWDKEKTFNWEKGIEVQGVRDWMMENLEKRY